MSIPTLHKLTAAVTLGLASTGAALAAPMVTDWGYSVTAQWTTTGAGAPAFTSGSGSTYTSANVLSWGANKNTFWDNTRNAKPQYWSGNSDNSRRSGLVITPNGPASGNNLQTNGAALDTHTVTHYNNTISGSFRTLLSATLHTTLTLTPYLPNPPYDGTDSWGPVARDFSISFTETTNSRRCADPLSASECDDLFVLAAGDLTDTFTLDGILYTISFNAPGLGALGAQACALAGAAADCVGLRTREGRTTSMTFNFMITAQDPPINVPEPGVLGLLGVGLAAVGLRGRRRRA